MTAQSISPIAAPQPTQSKDQGPWIDPQLELAGTTITLQPLGLHHLANLQESVDDGQLYHQWWTWTPTPDGMEADIREKLVRRDNHGMVPFAIVDVSTTRAVGVTTYYDLEPRIPRLSIGYTWLARSYWGGAANPEMKYLLLRYAFETLRCEAVEIRTKGTNAHSQRAIEKLGLTRDGVLRRAARLRNGTVDDAVVYSAIAPEWPDIRRRLEERLSQWSQP